MTTELITFKNLSCHFSSTVLGTRAISNTNRRESLKEKGKDETPFSSSSGVTQSIESLEMQVSNMLY